MKSGILTLIPTPIDEDTPLELTAFNRLKQATDSVNSIFVVEELRHCRRRWIRWGLPRDIVEKFVLYNEHNAKTISQELYQKLKEGRDIFFMSDCGLPAFCDPGQRLVDYCHNGGVKVTCTPFANSIALAVALSGFPHDRFVFEGFIPVKENRHQELKRISLEASMSIVMDTPYRLKRLLEEFRDLLGNKREIFVGLDLNQQSEELLRGSAEQLLKRIQEFKREFILIVGPLKRGER